jgi:hypothetical protein
LALASTSPLSGTRGAPGASCVTASISASPACTALSISVSMRALSFASIVPLSGASTMLATVANRIFCAGSALALGAASCGFSASSRACVIAPGTTSSCAMITRAPILVRPHRRCANSRGSRMQPCEAG